MPLNSDDLEVSLGYLVAFNGPESYASITPAILQWHHLGSVNGKSVMYYTIRPTDGKNTLPTIQPAPPMENFCRSREQAMLRLTHLLVESDMEHDRRAFDLTRSIKNA